jgi:hypothetical protein
MQILRYMLVLFFGVSYAFCAPALELKMEPQRVVVGEPGVEQYVYPEDAANVPIPGGRMKVLLKDGEIRRLEVSSTASVALKMFDTTVNLDPGGSITVTGYLENGGPQLSIDMEHGGMGTPGPLFEKPNAMTLFFPKTVANKETKSTPGFIPFPSLSSGIAETLAPQSLGSLLQKSPSGSKINIPPSTEVNSNNIADSIKLSVMETTTASGTSNHH